MIPIKYAWYMLCIASVLDCTEFVEGISPLFVQISKPSYNYESFLGPTGATGPWFLRPCPPPTNKKTKKIITG